MSAPRILMTADSVGGVWRYALDVGQQMSARGCTVAIACLGPEPSAAQQAEAREAGVGLIHLDTELDWTAENAGSVRAGAAALAAAARAWRPTLLHLNTPALAAYLRDAPPMLVAAHSCLATWWSAVKGGRIPDEWRWHFAATRAGLAAAACVVAPTRAFADRLAATYGPIRRLRVVANGARPTYPAAKQSFALAVGRWWDEAKNLRTLEAAARTAHCPFYAAGPLRGPNGCAAEVRAVRWLGELPHAEVLEWIARAPILVSPALYEPFGLAVLEAAHAGAALVLSDIAPFRELWDGCAVFVAPRDAAAIARAVDRLASDSEMRARLARQAAMRAQRYSLERQADALLDAYAATMSSRERVAV